jgi:hypothetical protein
MKISGTRPRSDARQCLNRGPARTCATFSRAVYCERIASGSSRESGVSSPSIRSCENRDPEVARIAGHRYFRLCRCKARESGYRSHERSASHSNLPLPFSLQTVRNRTACFAFSEAADDATGPGARRATFAARPTRAGRCGTGIAFGHRCRRTNIQCRHRCSANPELFASREDRNEAMGNFAACVGCVVRSDPETQSGR